METPLDPGGFETLPTLPPAPVPTQTHSPVFFGPFGLRAGWGMGIFVFFALFFMIAGQAAGIFASGQLKQIVTAQQKASANPRAPKPAVSIALVPIMPVVSDGIAFLGMLTLCWFFSKAERRELGSFGIGKTRLTDFLPGAFWGLASLSLLVLILHATHVLYFDRRLLFGWPVLAYGLKWLAGFLFVGLAEEYLLRGYLQYTLTRGLFGLAQAISPDRARFVAFWLAAIVMSLLFGALHLNNGGENAFGISQVVLVGLVFSYALWRTGSLWWAIGFHMAWDWAQSFLYGVPDSGQLSFGRLFQTHTAGKPLFSGGVDGPEGSLYCLFVMVLVMLIIRLTTSPGQQPPLEQQAPATPAAISVLPAPIA